MKKKKKFIRATLRRQEKYALRLILFRWRQGENDEASQAILALIATWDRPYDERREGELRCDAGCIIMLSRFERVVGVVRKDVFGKYEWGM